MPTKVDPPVFNEEAGPKIKPDQQENIEDWVDVNPAELEMDWEVVNPPARKTIFDPDSSDASAWLGFSRNRLFPCLLVNTRPVDILTAIPEGEDEPDSPRP
jgi:hypothetical protein